MLRSCLPFALFCFVPVAVQAQNCVYSTAFDGGLLSPNPLANHQMGSAVALEGDVAVTGATNVSPGGAAYVFERDPSGGWSQGFRLSPSTVLPPGAGFGEALATDGELVAIGVPRDEGFVSAATGAVYLFERDPGSPGAWREVTRIVPDDVGDQDEFGASVALSGDTLVVGAPNKLFSIHTTGAVYVFERNAGGPNAWGQVRRLRQDDPITNSRFGNAVEIHENRIVIGSEGDGSFFIFERLSNASNAWEQMHRFSTFQPNAFGTSIDVSGDTIVVGDDGDGFIEGYALVYQRRTGPLSVWDVVARLQADVSQSDNGFGSSVAVDGDNVLVGAPCQDKIGAGAAGRAYLYARDEGGPNIWGEIAQFEGQAPLFNDKLGSAVDLDRQRVLIGIPFDDPLNRTNAGSAEAYEFELLGPRSTVSNRNGGANPQSYAASTAVLGDALRGTCDLTTTGHSLAVFFAYDAPATIVLGGGQVLLCYEQVRQGELFSGRGILSSGPQATFSFPIPNDNSLCGTRLCTQVIQLAGVFPFALSNAQDIVIGL